MESEIEIAWVQTTTWDYIGIGKINVKYHIK